MKLNMQSHSFAGKLITFCGLDGSGKTTYIKKLSELFDDKKIPYTTTKQPTEQVRQSEMFRTYMDQTDHSAYDYRALSLYAASDRLQHTLSFIRPNLQNGISVLSDRYFYSCLANLHARGYTSDSWIYEVGSYLLKPDLSLFFDIDFQTAIERVRSRPSEKDRYIDIELQRRLREEYLEIAHIVGGVIIDTSNSPDVCFENIKDALKEKNIYV